MTSVWQKPHNINNTIAPYFNFIYESKKYLSNLNFATTTSIQFLHGSETAAVDDHGAVHGAGQTALTTYHLGQDEEHFNINILLFVFPRLLKLNIIPSRHLTEEQRSPETEAERLLHLWCVYLHYLHYLGRITELSSWARWSHCCCNYTGHYLV